MIFLSSFHSVSRKGKEVRLTFFLILRSYFWAYVRQYTACVLDLDIVLNLFFVMFLNKA